MATGESRQRLCNRLTYILRYGAVKEGLEVLPGGYVRLEQLLKLSKLRYYSKEDILYQIHQSKSITGDKKFVLKNEPSGNTLVKIFSGRKMEPSNYHPDSSVYRLVHICIKNVCNNIKYYNMEDFPDEYLLRRIFMMLKYEKKLTNATMKSLLSFYVDEYDFKDVYITESTIRLICQRCKLLKSLKLKRCSYVVTDNIVKLVAGNLQQLRELNVSHCTSLTDKSLEHLSKAQTPLEILNISHCNLITHSGIKNFLLSCVTLKTLVVQGFASINGDIYLEWIEARSKVSSENLDIFYINHDKESRKKRREYIDLENT